MKAPSAACGGLGACVKDQPARNRGRSAAGPARVRGIIHVQDNCGVCVRRVEFELGEVGVCVLGAKSITAVITIWPALALVTSSGMMVTPSHTGAVAVVDIPRRITASWRLVAGAGTWALTRTPAVNSINLSRALRLAFLYVLPKSLSVAAPTTRAKSLAMEA